MKLEQVQERNVKYVMGTRRSPYPDEFRVSNGVEILHGSPDICEDDFICYAPSLKSLKGGPTEVHGNYSINYTNISNLIGSPKIVHGSFSCSINELITLDGLSVEIGGTFSCAYNKLASLHLIHKQIKKMDGGFFAEHNIHLTKNLLGLLLIPGLAYVRLSHKDIANIINKHLTNPNKKIGMLQCQQELIEAGFEEAAQL